jgi:hypothetical protein
MIKSFRGKLADGEEEKIRLGTNNGLIGYKISKFQIMTEEPYGGATAEHIVKLTSQSQDVAATVDFNNPLLLGVAIINNATAGYDNASIPVIIFDNVKFNQDIFVSHKDNATGTACNYYIELEQVKLDLNEATVATLKDMRGRE